MSFVHNKSRWVSVPAVHVILVVAALYSLLPLVWLVISQAGVTVALRPDPPRKLVLTVAGIALVAVYAAVELDWYPVSMIGIDTRSNALPPTLALALLATAQLGGIAVAFR